MGTCLGTCKHKQRDHVKKYIDEAGHQHEVELEQDQGGGGNNFDDDVKGTSAASFRVKILVNKEELDWLLTQLREKKGSAKRLEDVVVEMKKKLGRTSTRSGRSSADHHQGYWKPSLESIKESPEVHTIYGGHEN